MNKENKDKNNGMPVVQTCEHRCGWVALMGPPNAGKSTLLNALIGQKVTIVTPKPQTTRNQIVGILTEPGMQAIFMDTPGLSQGRGNLSKSMMQSVWESLRQADVIITVLDSHTYILHPEYLEKDVAPLVDALGNDDRPMVIVVNKVDLFGDKSRMLPLLNELSERWPQAEIFPMSALEKDGILDLKKIIANHLPIAPAQFPEDQLSTLPVRFMASEIIREKIFLHMREEVPYGTVVDIERWEDATEGSELTTIYATIYVAKPMHKAMIIGRAGAMIKQLGTEARMDIQRLVGGKINLQLWVKVRDHWNEDTAFLHELELNSLGGLIDHGNNK